MANFVAISIVAISITCDSSEFQAVINRLDKRADLSPAARAKILAGIEVLNACQSFVRAETVMCNGEALVFLLPTPHLMALVEEVGA